MVKLSETELKMLIKGGETNTVELKLAAPRAVDLAERLCGMANAKGGIVIIGVEDSTHKVVGVPDERIGETMDVILRAARQVIKPELMLDPPEPEVYVLAGKKLLVVTSTINRWSSVSSGRHFLDTAGDSNQGIKYDRTVRNDLRSRST